MWAGLVGEWEGGASAVCGESTSEALSPSLTKEPLAGLVFRGQGKASVFTHLC